MKNTLKKLAILAATCLAAGQAFAAWSVIFDVSDPAAPAIGLSGDWQNVHLGIAPEVGGVNAWADAPGADWYGGGWGGGYAILTSDGTPVAILGVFWQPYYFPWDNPPGGLAVAFWIETPSDSSFNAEVLSFLGFAEVIAVTSDELQVTSWGEGSILPVPDDLDVYVVGLRPADTTPPVIHSVAASSGVLWPPNGQMVPVTVTANITDDTAVASATLIVADQYGILSGQVPMTLNAQTGLWVATVNLQAQRNGTDKNGRTYTLSVTATDPTGNVSTPAAAATVLVPHDQGKK